MSDENPELPRKLTPEAKRALAEAEERRAAAIAAEEQAKEEAEEKKRPAKKEESFFDNPTVKQVGRTAATIITRSLLGALGLGGRSSKKKTGWF